MRRKSYTREFKIRVVQEAIETGNNTVVARRYEVHPSMVARWVRQYKKRGEAAFQRTKAPTRTVAGPRELQELQRENDVMSVAHRLRDQRQSLDEWFVLRDEDDADALRDAAGVLRSTTGLFARLFSKEYRAAERMWKRRRRTPGKMDARQMARQLDELAEFYEAKCRLEQDNSLRELMGEGFRGLDTAFSRYGAVVSFARAIRQRTEAYGAAGLEVRRFLLHRDADELRALAVGVDGEPTFKAVYDALARTVADLGLHMDGTRELAAVREELNELAQVLFDMETIRTEMGLKEELGRRDVGRLHDSVKRRDEALQNIGNNGRAADVLQSRFQGEATDVELLKRALTLGSRPVKWCKLDSSVQVGDYRSGTPSSSLVPSCSSLR